ncbi:SUE1 [Nakaseomyces glabratus]|nr:Mitochondrial protein Pet20 [Nakaseomyces glabratus]KAH7595199.1 Mitochondrial protein Pet20 [Nakaseomyces glabratus]KAH7611283.1 Mitochondrial protein Pet20 [Nakaseomyces glabratus]KAI8383376.1 Mitochondrial protein Pet20 [Nakaseomyces glabratus]KAI8392761.1 Mitochondrial protein Pet20 [Nakaseomyces glabratus]
MKRVNEIFRKLPKVPMTRYLENRLLSEDMLYNGYRPILYPMRENPLLCHSNVRETHYYGESSNELQKKDEEPVNELLYGPEGRGGISTMGVRRMADPSKVKLGLSYSIMGMEYYPEWEKVPRDVVKRIKPYEVMKVKKKV